MVYVFNDCWINRGSFIIKMEKECKHEWRQRLKGDIESMEADGYYCIYCLEITFRNKNGKIV